MNSKNCGNHHYESDRIRKKKKNIYPYNVLINTFKKSIYEEVHASNLSIVLNILERRYADIKILIMKYKQGYSNESIAYNRQMSINQVEKSIESAKEIIIKYKDSLFNGFNNSKLCIELRKDFRKVGFSDSVILNLNKCGIYDIKDLESMSSTEFVNKLSDTLDEIEASEVISEALPCLHNNGMNISNLTKIKHTRVPNDNTATVYMVEPLVALHYTCPRCKKNSSFKMNIKIDSNGGISIDGYNGKRVICPKCNSTITLTKSNTLF